MNKKSVVWSFIVVACAGIAFVEICVAVKADFIQAWARGAMYLGAFLWVAVSIIGWLDRRGNPQENPFWSMLVISGLAACSVAGLFWPPFASFARGLNVSLLLLFCFGAIIELDKAQAGREPCFPGHAG